jgi:penicillin amidase
MSLQARDLFALLENTVPADGASRDALERLRAWNFEMAPDSAAAAIYAAWYVELAKMPADELGEVPRGRTRGRFLLEALRAGSGWCDDTRTPGVQTCGEFQAASLQAALATLGRRLGADPSAWKWERLHRAVFPHDVFHEVPLLSRAFDLEIGQGGDGTTPNVGAFAQDGSFQMDDGPSYRQIVDLADPSRSRFVHTTGQSGNVFARHYRDLLPVWRAGGYFAIGEAPARTLILEPAPAGR